MQIIQKKVTNLQFYNRMWLLERQTLNIEKTEAPTCFKFFFKTSV